ncbi:hypothetical protein ciss_11300 [Carboxydothermus islandicus]|uniref:Polymerase nucleotidyl transferase domain-containing protein n=1 Tax=Carboxydothermus islandicus TaxID=661089 RepID=A0A1L8D262_9THEO|nr:nucleotidyltransferase domain-containing protein [Carboxydothermus islandicus]GAV25197.1 hypothetical protein ciss_11300 [Carboxydothermus islandicus]
MNDYIENKKIDSLLNELVMELQKVYGTKLKDVILFGSYGRGEQDKESDIDIAVIVDMDDEELKKYEEKLNDIAGEYGYRYLKVISLIDISYNKFKKYKDVVPFYRTIENEGVTLYG